MNATAGGVSHSHTIIVCSGSVHMRIPCALWYNRAVCRRKWICIWQLNTNFPIFLLIQVYRGPEVQCSRQLFAIRRTHAPTANAKKQHKNCLSTISYSNFINQNYRLMHRWILRSLMIVWFLFSSSGILDSNYVAEITYEDFRTQMYKPNQSSNFTSTGTTGFRSMAPTSLPYLIYAMLFPFSNCLWIRFWYVAGSMLTHLQYVVWDAILWIVPAPL